jgi:hypothetical protein
VQTRVQELERQVAERPAGGGFLSGLFERPGRADRARRLGARGRWRQSTMA